MFLRRTEKTFQMTEISLTAKLSAIKNRLLPSPAHTGTMVTQDLVNLVHARC
jgi:hypothetical protein